MAEKDGVTVESLVTNFHFLRPLWLLGCIPALILFGISWFMRVQSSRWNKTIDRSLLPYLLDQEQSRRQGWPLYFLFLAWLLTCFSLAGPVWKKLPQPVQKKEDALVIIQDLSLSLYAQDLSPNRLVRVQHKLKDILDERVEGTTALVVYSGDAHIVSPLTDDSDTIAAMVPALSPGIMPSYGSNVTAAVEIALQLFKDVGAGQGRILLLTDEVTREDADKITRLLKGKGVTLSVLGVGTRDGGPIPKSDGGFWKDEQGNIIIPRLNSSVLAELAQGNNGKYREITLDDTDIRDLLDPGQLMKSTNGYREVDREFDQWEEMGPWILLAVLPLALLAFRRGWIVVVLVAIMLSGHEAHALSWNDLWQRQDQQGAKALAEGDPQQAADLFSSQQWKGIAQYKAGNFEEAVEAFEQGEDADAYYNRGNALAKAGKLDDAVKTYEQALQLDPEMEDARANKELVEQVIRKQQEQQNQQQNQQDGQDQQQKNDQKGDKKNKPDEGQSQDQQPGDEQKQEGSSGQQQDQQPGDEQKQQGSSGQQQEQRGDQENQAQTPSRDQQNGSETENEQERGQRNVDSEDSNPEKQQFQGAEKNEADAEKNDQESAAARLSEDELTGEEQQALEQWLRQVPDNPGGLLKRKFEYEYRKNQGRRQAEPDRKIW